MIEKWMDVPGFEGYYQVSDMGQLRSVDRLIKRSNGQLVSQKGRTIKPNIDRDGYVIYGLRKNNIRKVFKAHRLVMSVFVGDSPLTVDHKNSNKKDNSLENLSYMTTGENTRKAFLQGAHTKNLSIESVKKIRRDISLGLKKSEIMKKHKIKRSNYGYIKNNLTWVDIVF